jgi:hypothetical protein
MTRGQRTRRHLILAGVLSTLPGVAYAQDNIQLSADTSANIGYSTNPFTEVNGDKGSGVIDVQVRPRATLVTEHSTFTLSGSAQYQKYFRRYDDAQNYLVGLDYNGRPSERLTTHLGATYDSSIIGSTNQFNGAFDPTQPIVPPIIGSDLALFGTRDRRQTLRVDGDFNYTLSARDSITPSAYYVRTRYNRFSQGNYDGYGGTLAYSRQISERLRIGAQGTVAKYDYEGLLGDSTVYTIRGTGSYTFSPRWKVDGAVGVSFVNEDVRGSRATLSGNINLCRLEELSNICIALSRSVVPSGIAGTQTETSIGVNYSNRISERGTIFANANYSKNGNNNPLLLFGSNEYFSASAGYERSINERLRITTTGRYRDVFGVGGNRAADYGGQIGVAYKIGDTK